ncbi:NUDIX hydrolase [Niveibacterium sp. SC-1]|uniref:NUDIX hydrolase n=1 Tax=Niveibacterium sp. SC-1 TaxID=3135646 RepID=UPI00311FACEE
MSTPHDPAVATIATLDSRTVYENRWMRVREDRIRRASGAEGIYGVVEKPDFAVIAPIDAGRVHLVQQYRYPVSQRFWEFPQGSWEGQPDIDPTQLAIAELREETGLVAGSMQMVGHLFAAYGYSTQGYNVFFASALSVAPTDARDAEEEDLISRAFTLAEMEAMILAGEIKDATTVAVLGLLRMKGLI